MSFIASTMYIKLSNYWIGSSILEKVQIHTTVLNKKANEVAIVKEIMINLEKLIKSPNNIKKILELAEINLY